MNEQTSAASVTSSEHAILGWLVPPPPPGQGLMTGQGGVPVPLWEWSVARDACGASAGISMTRHGAMQGLAKALVNGGRPRTGEVVPVLLTDPVHTAPYYLRGIARHTASYDGEVIQWRQ